MRLLYLHLPNYGPLRDVEVVFRREELLKEGRPGFINFVVGVNGTGKSTMLRAVFETFRYLAEYEVPLFPISIAWRIKTGPNIRDVLFHHSGGGKSGACLALLSMTVWGSKQYENPPEPDLETWRKRVAEWTPPDAKPQWIQIIRGHEFENNKTITEHLPRQVLAYTSGESGPWLALQTRWFRADQEELPESGVRPAVWNVRREFHERLPDELQRRVRRHLRECSEVGGQDDMIAAANELRRWRAAEAAILEHSHRTDLRVRMVEEKEASLAAAALLIQETASLFHGYNEDWQLTARRKRLMELQRSRTKEESDSSAALLLAEVDIFHATHLALTVNPDAFLSGREHFWQLSVATMLAETIVPLPLGRQQFVFCLGRRWHRTPLARWKSLLPEEGRGDIAGEYEGLVEMSNGAAALASVLGRTRDPGKSAGGIFRELQAWQRAGWLEDVALTVKRLTPVPGADGESDDAIVTWADLSDGEQLLISRMALIFLAASSEDSLLLLDEPETHFNDLWKRELIDLIDDNLLKKTNAHVLVATHTSIALSDVFADEVTVLRKEDGQTRACRIQGGLFGADQGEIMMNVFGAESSMGRRAQEFLDQMLSHEWKPEEADQLAKVVDRIGSSLYRAELRHKLNQLREAAATREEAEGRRSSKGLTDTDSGRDLELTGAGWLESLEKLTAPWQAKEKQEDAEEDGNMTM